MWALTALFGSDAGPVAGYVRARSPAEPDDLVGEIFTSVFTSLDRFSGGEADFRGWLFTIAQRRIVDDLRRRSRRVETTAYSPEEDSRQARLAPTRSLPPDGRARCLPPGRRIAHRAAGWRQPFLESGRAGERRH
jgi:RNA polymerase sigma-70 factor (ECF subfamily)